MSDDAPWTLGRLLQWTATYLKEHGSDSPRLDAEVLLAHACGCQRIELYTRFEEQPSEPLKAQFRDLVRRRAQGTPVAYLVGYREFYSLRFRVSPAVLIPRPETELVLIGLFDCIKAHGSLQDSPRIVDIGTGSGVLAITAAKHLPHARITAVELQPEALEVARANAIDHGVLDRIEWVQSDLFDALPVDTGNVERGRFDYVISNPPYIGLRERDALPRDVRDYEPATALFAGEDGLDILRRLVAQCASRLRPGGYLLSEISPWQTEPLGDLLQQQAGWEAPRFLDDLDRRPRVLVARRSSGA